MKLELLALAISCTALAVAAVCLLLHYLQGAVNAQHGGLLARHHAKLFPKEATVEPRSDSGREVANVRTS